MDNRMRMYNWNLAHKRVFLRADLNTPAAETLFIQSLKFQRLLPTLRYLKQAGARITLATHRGRPNGFDQTLSTRQLTHYFNQYNFSTVFSTVDTLASTLTGNADIILLENVRFYPEEKSASPAFAQQITQGCDYFIEDGFGVLARQESSVTTAAQLFYYKNRSIGLLVAEELKNLQPIKDDARPPFLIVLGGKKGREKLETLTHFFNKVTHIALCPGVSELPEVQDFIQKATVRGIIVMLPHDYIVINNQKVSIGPQTLKEWQTVIATMNTIIYNGLMGFLEYPKTTSITQQLFTCFAESNASCILAGGDTTLAAHHWNITGKKLFLSTGGGATLAYLSGQPLPGLEIIT